METLDPFFFVDFRGSFLGSYLRSSFPFETCFHPPTHCSGQERLEIVKQFCNYGLEHWGSDDKGVENTRKFLLGTNTITTYSVCVEG